MPPKSLLLNSFRFVVFMLAVSIEMGAQAPVTSFQLFDFNASLPVNLNHLQRADGTVDSTSYPGYGLALSSVMRVVPGATLTWHSPDTSDADKGLFYGSGGPFPMIEYFQDSAATHLVASDYGISYVMHDQIFKVPTLGSVNYVRVQLAFNQNYAFPALSGATLTTDMPYAPPPSNMGTTATDTTLYNVIFGAFNSIPTGESDTVFGVGAGAKLTTGREMTIVGAQACANFDGDANANPYPENGLSTCIGSLAGANMVANGLYPSIDNVFVGQKAGLNGTALRQETFVGTHAATAIVTGRGDTIIGAHSMDSGVVNSQFNTVVGFYNLNAPGGGDKANTVVVGAEAAGSLISSQDVIIVGYAANSLTKADNSIIIGDYAASQGTELSQSVIIGSQAGRNAPSSSVVLGSYSAPSATARGTFVGFGAGSTVTTGPDNTCLGYYSCGHLTSGDHNVAVGAGSGNGLVGGESFTSALGYGAQTGQGVNNAAQIGYGVNPTSNSFQFEDSQIIDGNGDLHTGTSAPASNTACTTGAIRVVMPYIYACVATNVWMRATLSTF